GPGGGIPTNALETFLVVVANTSIAPGTDTYGAMIIPAATVRITSIRVRIESLAAGNVTAAIYNANTNARLAITSAVAAVAGFQTLTLTTGVVLNAQQLYYLAIATTSNSTFTAYTVGNQPATPLLAWTQGAVSLPSTITPVATTIGIWASAF